VRAVPRLCDFYPGICLITEEKARKNLSQGKKNLSQSTEKPQSKYRKTSVKVQKNLSQSTEKSQSKYTVIHITKNTNTLLLNMSNYDIDTRY
jgi:uroporphyrinogen-III decarboxylase